MGTFINVIGTIIGIQVIEIGKNRTKGRTGTFIGIEIIEIKK